MGGVSTAAQWVSERSPPTFLAHSLGDEDLPAVVQSDPLHAALLSHSVVSEYYRSDFGGHGCGLVEAWGAPCLVWLAAHAFAVGVDDYVYDFADPQFCGWSGNGNCSEDDPGRVAMSSRQ